MLQCVDGRVRALRCVFPRLQLNGPTGLDRGRKEMCAVRERDEGYRHPERAPRLRVRDREREIVREAPQVREARPDERVRGRVEPVPHGNATEEDRRAVRLPMDDRVPEQGLRVARARRPPLPRGSPSDAWGPATANISRAASSVCSPCGTVSFASWWFAHTRRRASAIRQKFDSSSTRRSYSAIAFWCSN